MATHPYLALFDAGPRTVGGLALKGDKLAIGARLEDGAATDIDGDQTDNALSGAGAVYTFIGSGNTWVQQAYVKASNPGTNDEFGESVSLSGDTLVACAPHRTDQRDGDQRQSGRQLGGVGGRLLHLPMTWNART